MFIYLLTTTVYSITIYSSLLWYLLWMMIFFWYFFNQCKSINYRTGFESSSRKKGNGPIWHLVVPVKLFMFNNIKNDVTLIVDQVGDLFSMFSFTILFHLILEKKPHLTSFDITQKWPFLEILEPTAYNVVPFGMPFGGLSRNVLGNPAGLSLRLCCSLACRNFGWQIHPQNLT